MDRLHTRTTVVTDTTNSYIFIVKNGCRSSFPSYLWDTIIKCLPNESMDYLIFLRTDIEDISYIVLFLITVLDLISSVVTRYMCKHEIISEHYFTDNISFYVPLGSSVS